MMTDEDFELPQTSFDIFRKRAGLILGPAFFILFYFSPIELPNPEAKRLLAIFVWVVVWWICEPIPLSATALLGAVLMVALQVGSVKEIFSPFADPIIFLFMGSFFIARGMQVHGLDTTIAEMATSNKILRRNPFIMFASLGFFVSLLSMWLSNSSVTAIFYPISLGLIGHITKEERRKYAPSLLLLVAYSASLGGIGTPVGTPPNLIGISMLKRFANIEIPFLTWMVFAVPIFLIGFLAFVLILKLKEDLPSKEIKFETIDNKKITRNQKLVLFVFLITVFLWLIPGFLNFLLGEKSIVAKTINSSLPEPAVAIFGALLLFIIPTVEGKKRKLLNWKEASLIDWGTLILFGGGLSLGSMMFETKLAQYFGEKWLNLFGKTSITLLTFLSILFAVILTEVVSNTAAANIIIPVIISIAGASHISPLRPVIGATIGCSLAFMLPVSTPPNAIVYGSNLVPISEMIKKGLLLDAIMITVTFLFLILVFPLLPVK